MLSRSVFAVGSLFLFASVERLDQRIFHVLYWIGMLWGTLAVL
jgi:hypothetical protein